MIYLIYLLFNRGVLWKEQKTWRLALQRKMLIGEICEINERKSLRISCKGKEDTIFVEDLISDIITLKVRRAR